MERMRVTEVKTFLLGGSWRNWLIVVLETDAGICGVGEATLEGKSKTVEAAVGELERYIVGQDPFAIERHFQEMYRRAFYAGGASPPPAPTTAPAVVRPGAPDSCC